MDTKKTCQHCGKILGPEAIEGLCPDCLMKMGLGIGTEASAAAPQEKRAFTAPTPAQLAPKFPQLEILVLIGQGGMGAVYKARQRQLDRMVALKILPPGIGEDSAFADRFAREAKAMAKLNHLGIVTIHDFGHAGGLYYFIMELVDGVSLRLLMHNGRVSPREALAIVPQICDALQYAHDQGIVHRDIKPENILLDRQGRVKVADFGLAKLVGAPNESVTGAEPTDSSSLTEAGKVIGTPHYMAPEQVDHPGEVDHRADIYALGVVFYQMLTGELPAKRIEPPSKKVQIDVRLDEVVLRALEKEPERRYQQVSEVKTAVEKITGQLTEGPAATTKPSLRTSDNPVPSTVDVRGWNFSGLKDTLTLQLLSPQAWIRRITTVERNIVLPIKAAVIIMLFQYLRAGSHWFTDTWSLFDASIFALERFFWFYSGINVATAVALLVIQRLPVRPAQAIVFMNCLLDGCFLATLTVVTGGFDSVLYWLFLGLIVRGAVITPRAGTQLLLNLAQSAFYLAAGLFDSFLARQLSDTELRVLGLYAPGAPVEPVLLRVIVLLVVTIGCYGGQVLLRRPHAGANAT